MFGLQLSLTRKLGTTLTKLTNKVRGKIFYKEVFLRLSVCVVYSCDFIIVRLNYYWVGMYPAYICIFLHESADDYLTRVNCNFFLNLGASKLLYFKKKITNRGRFFKCFFINWKDVFTSLFFWFCFKGCSIILYFYFYWV